MKTVSMKMSTAKKITEPMISIPKRTQEYIEVKKVAPDGIFEVSKGVFSKTYMLDDINYTTKNMKEQVDVAERLTRIFTTFSLPFQITFYNRKRSQDEIENTLFYPLQRDKWDKIRGYYNDIISDRVISSKQGIVQNKYITLTVECSSYEEAREQFRNCESSLQRNLVDLGSAIKPISGTDRIRLLQEIYQYGEIMGEKRELDDIIWQVQDWKNDVAASKIDFKTGQRKGYFTMNDKYFRALYIMPSRYPNESLRDTFITDVMSIPSPIMTTVNYAPVAKEIVSKVVENKYSGVEGTIYRQQQKHNKNNAFSSDVSYTVRQKLKDVQTIMDNINDSDTEFMYVGVNILLMEDSLEALERVTESIESYAIKASLKVRPHRNQQREALNTILPLGIRQVQQMRILYAESATAFMPFSVQELCEDGMSFMYGFNQVSKSLVKGNRRNLNNGNGFIFGGSGYGKSVAAKLEMGSVFLNTKDDLIVIDPMNEYKDWVKGFDGECVEFSAQSMSNLNFLDVDIESLTDNNLENVVSMKSEYILSIVEQSLLDPITSIQQAIIVRCVKQLYAQVYKEKKQAEIQTLINLIDDSKEKGTHDVAVSLEIFVDGYLKMFGRPTNVNLNNRFTVYDISEMGKKQWATSMLIIMESIMTRIKDNMKKGVATWIWMDEFHELLKMPLTEQFFIELWREIRKMGGFVTGITQNIGLVLEDTERSSLVENSEFAILMNAKSNEAELIADTFPEISEAEVSYITHADIAQGLLKYGKAIIPIDNTFDKSNPLYDYVNTNFHEKSAMKKLDVMNE